LTVLLAKSTRMTDRGDVPRRALVLIAAITALLGAAAPAVGQTIPTILPTTTTTAPTTTTTTTTTSSSTTSTTAGSSTTSTTVGAQAGALSITVPSDVNAGAQSAASGTSFSVSLGTVEVNDSRAGLARTWTTSVSSSSFTGPGGTITAGSIRYWSGPATGSSGTIVLIPGQLTSVGAVTLDSTRTAFSSTGGVGTTSASWSPTIIVTVPSGALSGAYSGTITHSVA
jgi:hypothetical protein